MLLLIFLFISNIIAAPTKIIGEYSVTIDSNNVLMNIVPNKSIDKDLNKNLNLSSLHISRIDQRAFDNVRELESLDLSKNNISILSPGTFSVLRNLKHLSLANNKLNNFHRAFKDLTNLESLNISNISIRDLGISDLYGIPNSAIIYTDGDKIETISRAIFAKTYTHASGEAVLCQRKGIVSSLRYRRKRKVLPKDCTIVKIDSSYPHLVRLNGSGITGFDRGWYHLYYMNIDGLDLSNNSIVDITTEFINVLPRHLNLIDLSKNKIARINEGSFVHSNLESLNLSDNLINEIESHAFKLPSLQELKLNGNRLNNLHFVETLTSHLLHLDLQNNQLGEVQLANSFSNLRALTYLNLDGNNITELKSEHLFGLKSLTNLYLGHNGLRKIHPYCFDHTLTLKELNLSNNHLTDLEYYVFFISVNIEILDLSHNNLTDLPRFLFSQLKELKYLYLGYNNLTSLYRAFVGLSNLNLLDLSYNPIVSAEQDDFTGVPTTVTILSDGNAISNTTLKDNLMELVLPEESEGGPPILLCMRNGIVKEVRHMTKTDAPMPKDCQTIKLFEVSVNGFPEIAVSLKSFHISGFANNWYRLGGPISTIILDKNDIDRVESSMLNDLPHYVKYVYVRNNKIKNLKKGVIVNSHLKILHLNGNQIGKIEEDALINTNLEEVSVAFNPVVGAQFVSGMPSCLKHLDAKGLYLEEIPADTFSRLNKLTTLNLQFGKLKNIESRSFHGLSSLKTLLLDRNELTTIHQDAFQDTKSLERISLDINQLHKLDKLVFRDLTNLTNLHLQFNRFKNVTKETFPHFPNSLQSLDLRNNGMYHIEPDSFAGGLKYELLLHGNRLNTIDSGVFNLPDLVKLDLSDNQLTRLNGESFKNLPNLEELDLNENNITEIDKGAAKYLNRLYFLDLSKNPITILGNDAFDGLSNLPDQKFEAVIFVEETPIKQISGGLFGDEN